jgi:nucleoside-diphosphate-sugar epimerase
VDSFFVGCGYVGRQVACRERDDGGAIAAIVRTRVSAAALIKEGIGAEAADLDRQDPCAVPAAGRVLYWFTPPQPDGDQDLRLRRLIHSLGAHDSLPTRVVLISTTGVYGDCRGEWVTEDRALAPQTDRAQRRVDAEDTLGHWCEALQIPLVVLRVPGIYGPGKLPLKRLQSGQPVLVPQICPWSNRVHVEDLVSACFAAARIDTPRPVYNISDGSPSTMTDFFFQVADAAGLPRPPVIDADAAPSQLSAAMRSYLAESKRIDNSLMRQHLNVTVCYPDLASGLAQMVWD